MKYSRSSVMKPIAGSIIMHDIILRFVITIIYNQT